MWWKSPVVTFVLSALGSFAFDRVGDATWEHAGFLGLGVGCAALTLHRLIIVVDKS